MAGWAYDRSTSRPGEDDRAHTTNTGWQPAGRAQPVPTRTASMRIESIDTMPTAGFSDLHGFSTRCERSPGGMSETFDDAGRLLRRFRVAAGLTQSQLAASARISVATVRDLEQGRSLRPQARSVRLLAEALNLPAEAVATLQAVAAPSGAAPPVPSTGLTVGVLGVVEVRYDGVPVPLNATGPRALLARLALSPNVAVSRGALFRAIWGEHPPDAAASLLQCCVARLRRTLRAAAGAAGHALVQTVP